MPFREIDAETVVGGTAFGMEGISIVEGLVGGGYVVLWQAADGDSLSDVWIQVFGADGLRIGQPRLLLDDYLGYQTPRDLDVVALPNGNFAIATVRGLTPSTLEISLQIFTAEGIAVGSPISVTAPGVAWTPAIAVAGEQIVVSWYQTGEVWGRLYDLNGIAAGSAIMLGDGSVVNNPDGTTSYYDARTPAVAGLADGQFVVAWVDMGPNAADPSRTSVWARLFNEAGTAIGQPFLVNTTTLGQQQLPQIVVLSNGNFVVTWDDNSSGTEVLRAQIFTPTGQRVGGELTLADTQDPASFFGLSDYGVTALAQGGFTVTWQGNDNLVYVREFDNAGAALQAPFAVSASSGSLPWVAGLSDGGYVVAWGWSYIYAQRFALEQPLVRAALTLTASGQDFTIGGDVVVYGTTSGGEVIELLDGDIRLDPSFNLGGDTVVLPGNAGGYTMVLSGSFVTFEAAGITVAIPVGIAGINIQFADSTRSLRFDSTAGQVMLGAQAVTSSGQPVAASGAPLVEAVVDGPDSLGRLVLGEPGQDIDIGGNVSIFGTIAGGEVMTVLAGTVALDASFNVGGDRVVLPGNAGSYTVSLSGSFVTIAGGDVSVAIPVGTAGLVVDFADADRMLRYDTATGQVVLGTQPVTPTPAPVATAGMAGAAMLENSAGKEPAQLLGLEQYRLDNDSFSFG